LFCIPAQLTIPLLVRWMLMLEDSDEDRLYFGRGLPREWVASGKEIRIEGAPTRWGRVNLSMVSPPSSNRVNATVDLARAGSPKEIHVKVRLAKNKIVQAVNVNGHAAAIAGLNKDTVIIPTGTRKHFEIVGQFT